MKLGPDAARYWIAAQGRPVARPFHLRWLMPRLCGTSPRRWWSVWALSWPILAASVAWLADSLGWQRATFAAVLTIALPGVWGPLVVRPVGVDLPAMALAALAAAAAVHGVWWLAIPVVMLAAATKESAPVWAALWAWNPLLLVGMAWVIPAWFRRHELDEVTAREPFRTIHEHPISTAIAARRGRWRDAWLFIAPWGACLAAMWHPTTQTIAVVVVAHLQLLVATDTVRLLHTAAGPALAIAAARNLPTDWLPLVALGHGFWWRKPEVV